MTVDTEMLEELKKIREALAPTPPPEEPTKKKNMIQEFKEFIIKYKVLGLAVAFIMGQYLGDLVGSLVNNLVMPLVTFFLPASIPWEEFTLWVFRIGAFNWGSYHFHNRGVCNLLIGEIYREIRNSIVSLTTLIFFFYFLLR